MQRRHSHRWIIGFIAGLVSQSALACPARPLTIGWNLWEPYAYPAPDGSPDGLDVALTEAILTEAGCTFRWVEVPAVRALRDVAEGRLDMVAAASRTGERAAFAHFSHAYRREVMSLVTRRDLLPDVRLATLREFTGLGYRLAAAPGFYGRELEALRADASAPQYLNETPTPERLLPLLIAGRVDGVIGDPVNLRRIADREGTSDQLRFDRIITNADDIVLLLSRLTVQDSALPPINAAIARVLSQARYADLITRYTATPALAVQN